MEHLLEDQLFSLDQMSCLSIKLYSESQIRTGWNWNYSIVDTEWKSLEGYPSVRKDSENITDLREYAQKRFGAFNKIGKK